jgi:hypothetical protein
MPRKMSITVALVVSQVLNEAKPKFIFERDNSVFSWGEDEEGKEIGRALLAGKFRTWQTGGDWTGSVWAEGKTKDFKGVFKTYLPGLFEWEVSREKLREVYKQNRSDAYYGIIEYTLSITKASTPFLKAVGGKALNEFKLEEKEYLISKGKLRFLFGPRPSKPGFAGLPDIAIPSMTLEGKGKAELKMRITKFTVDAELVQKKINP